MTARRFSGQLLRAERLAVGLSPEQLALRIGRSVFAVHSYERGAAVPSVAVLGRLADELRRPTDAFFEGGRVRESWRRSPMSNDERARRAASAMHAQGKTNTGPAREALQRKFEQQVDPEGVLSPDLLAEAVSAARSAYYRDLALKSAATRRTKKASA